MDQNIELIQQILSQLEENYKKFQKLDENLRISLYEQLKAFPNCDEIIEEFEKIFSLSYDENDKNSKEQGHEDEVCRSCVNTDPKSSTQTPETPKSSQKATKLSQTAPKCSTDLPKSYSENQTRSSDTANPVNFESSTTTQRSSMNEKERNQMCVELFADFGSFFNRSLSKVGFKYCTETEIVRTENRQP
ncbi:unnamed protein product [Chironomus riparius]|uniref:Uncharacterized protein n=1 Tax=Chironomus riparius TaxID=315576 RepID=A0A9N9S8Q9_9DIPT|nr:unnamed protein product [Chironomus riparius]